MRRSSIRGEGRVQGSSSTPRLDSGTPANGWRRHRMRSPTGAASQRFWSRHQGAPAWSGCAVRRRVWWSRSLRRSGPLCIWSRSIRNAWITVCFDPFPSNSRASQSSRDPRARRRPGRRRDRLPGDDRRRARRRAAPAIPLAARGMWIGTCRAATAATRTRSPARPAADAVGTLIVERGDGIGYGSQFTPQLVAQFHRRGLRVCAWQYVYGTNPSGEARSAARAVAAGADRFVVDAETEYEGRYASAQVYLAEHRRRIGRGYPLGLASFPFVDYHPAFPYSVFLGRGGAQFDLPQMYWHDIGTRSPACSTTPSPATASTGATSARSARPTVRPERRRRGASGPSRSASGPAESRGRTSPGPRPAGLWPAIGDDSEPPATRRAAGRACRPARRATMCSGTRSTRHRGPRPADDRAVRPADARRPPRLPGAPASAGDRDQRRGDLASPAAPRPGRGHLGRSQRPRRARCRAARSASAPTPAWVDPRARAGDSRARLVTRRPRAATAGAVTAGGARLSLTRDDRRAATRRPSPRTG